MRRKELAVCGLRPDIQVSRAASLNLPAWSCIFAIVAAVCACAPSRNAMNDSSLVGTARFLALGDSYTIGEAVDPPERWPMQLTAQLRASGIEVAEPVIIAKTGWTTDELDAAIDDAKPDSTYDLVTLLVGVNDQYRGREPEAYRLPFRKLLHRAIAFAGGSASRVIVISIPDWGVTPFAEGRDRAAIGMAIDRFNTVNRDETLKVGAHYVDITPGSREAATDQSLLASDGLHPSARMYDQWTRAIHPVAMTILLQHR